MIEIPRAALTADKIAEYAQFFSFGTNDLTQMGFGFSRDDIGSFLPDYLEQGILPVDPFTVIDRSGIGELMKIAVEKGRATRPNIKLGICGEHGGEPNSVEFCHMLGLNYVSCSPFRVPIARLAAARANAEEKAQQSTKKVTAKKPVKKAPKKVVKKVVKKAAAKKVVKKAAPKAAKKVVKKVAPKATKKVVKKTAKKVTKKKSKK